ncbi:uncharacterized protein LOC128184140 [Crassostrea angulata]|uniref:uncharacterized protein LOC128184140 n=1 Tax=Magallana angulata TaxID=2784310 RepID=UPI0022B1582C|nr:uncharacterized protein LOC128184140 [Crassostrea angulata]
MAANGLINKEKLRKTHLCFGNDSPGKISSYWRDYGPDTLIPCPLPSIGHRPQTHVEVLPVSDYSADSRFLTSTKQHYSLYNKEISDRIRQRCLQSSDINKALHGGRSVTNYQETLPPVTRHRLDYRPLILEAGPSSQGVIRRVRDRSGPIRFKESTIATEAMHAFQWPKARALPPWLQKNPVH